MTVGLICVRDAHYEDVEDARRVSEARMRYAHEWTVPILCPVCGTRWVLR